VKKSLLSAVSVFFMVLFLVGTARAVMVDVYVSPEKIYPGGATTITIWCNEDAAGSITVITPLGSPSAVSITLTANVSESVEYPTDFPGGNTKELGRYEVIVALKGQEWRAVFWVSFIVIPEVPFGTIMATVASFGAILGVARLERARRY
jgi:hypothetical protein